MRRATQANDRVVKRQRGRRWGDDVHCGGHCRGIFDHSRSCTPLFRSPCFIRQIRQRELCWNRMGAHFTRLGESTKKPWSRSSLSQWPANDEVLPSSLSAQADVCGCENRLGAERVCPPYGKWTHMVLLELMIFPLAWRFLLQGLVITKNRRAIFKAAFPFHVAVLLQLAPEQMDKRNGHAVIRFLERTRP